MWVFKMNLISLAVFFLATGISPANVERSRRIPDRHTRFSFWP